LTNRQSLLFIVDAHFSRSLGSDAWKEIQRVASIKKDAGIPAPTTPEIESVKDYSSPATKLDRKTKTLENGKEDGASTP